MRCGPSPPRSASPVSPRPTPCLSGARSQGPADPALIASRSSPRRAGATGQALMLAFGAGAGLAVQAFVNGRLGEDLDSPLLAGTVNQGVGLATLLLVGAASGALVRA